MKQRRKFLQMLDVRVRHSLASHSLNSTSTLNRVHSIDSLAADHADFIKAFSLLERTAETGSL